MPTYPVRPAQQSRDNVSRSVAANRQAVLQRAANPGGGKAATAQRKQAGQKKWSAAEQKQREEAGRKSAAKRRKGGASSAGRGGAKATPEQVAALKAIAARVDQVKKLYRSMVGMGLKPEDLTRSGDTITAKSPEAHEKLLRAMKKLGMEFDVNEDGSAQFVNPLTDKVTRIGKAPGKLKWTRDGASYDDTPQPEKPMVKVTVGDKNRAKAYDARTL